MHNLSTLQVDCSMLEQEKMRIERDPERDLPEKPFETAGPEKLSSICLS